MNEALKELNDQKVEIPGFKAKGIIGCIVLAIAVWAFSGIGVEGITQIAEHLKD